MLFKINDSADEYSVSYTQRKIYEIDKLLVPIGHLMTLPLHRKLLIGSLHIERVSD